ncbi:MAG: hypothetical protein WGN25_02090 [Candidatus Electrothrix sp. GW3-4]|uniref:hypothetical protein n=1 Tax=Candidatus Electrothrix sp. GW3-4 TaxID=3126740 RepID=UPI0030D29E49
MFRCFAYPTTFFPECNRPDRFEEKYPDIGSKLTKALMVVVVLDKVLVVKKLTWQGKDAILNGEPAALHRKKVVQPPLQAFRSSDASCKSVGHREGQQTENRIRL